MTEIVLRKSIYLRATPAQVWAYLTDPDKLEIWFHKPQAPLLDGKYEMISAESGTATIWGEVLYAEPFSRLEYSFNISATSEPSRVIWTLEETPAGTNLHLEHEGLPQETEAFGLALALDKGWEDHLDRMRSSLHE